VACRGEDHPPHNGQALSLGSPNCTKLRGDHEQCKSALPPTTAVVITHGAKTALCEALDIAAQNLGD
jgi:hypothetical protein